MRKLFLILSFIGAFATVASAQKEFAALDLPMNRAEDLVSVADKNGNVAIYYYQNGNLNFALVSPSGEQVAKHEIPYRLSQDPQLLGTRVTDDEFIFYSRHTSGRKEFIQPFAINRKSGAFRSLQETQLKIDRNMSFLGGFGDNQNFYLLYTDKDGNLHMYRDGQDAGMFEQKTFETDMPRTRERYARENELIFVHPDLERSVFTGHHRSKIYLQDNKIHMIFDGYPVRGKDSDEVTTEILTLDWQSGESTYRTLPTIEQRGNPSFNSFLHNNTLFRVNLEKDMLNLTAYNFNTLQPVKEYKYSDEEEITIKSTPVQQRGAGGIFSPEKKVIEKTSKVMKNLANGIPAITVDTFNDSTLQLTIGSYLPPHDNNRANDRNRMVRTPDQYVSTPRGLMMIPGRWVPAYHIPSYYLSSPFYSRYFYDPFGQGAARTPSGPGTSTYFRAVLDADDLSKAEQDEKAVVVLQDKVDEFEQELKPTPSHMTVYRYGDKLHYGYYDKRTRTYRIVEFTPEQQAAAASKK